MQKRLTPLLLEQDSMSGTPVSRLFSYFKGTWCLEYGLCKLYSK